MNTKQDGGPAFPAPDDYTKEGLPLYGPNALHGMSLRDYFAAKAMAGAIADGALVRIAEQVEGEKADMTLDGVSKITNQLLSRMMYEIADAMLEARKQ
jgi:hypothetical protein